jgi:hypothetical protein
MEGTTSTPSCAPAFIGSCCLDSATFIVAHQHQVVCDRCPAFAPPRSRVSTKPPYSRPRSLFLDAASCLPGLCEPAVLGDITPYKGSTYCPGPCSWLRSLRTRRRMCMMRFAYPIALVLCSIMCFCEVAYFFPLLMRGRSWSRCCERGFFGAQRCFRYANGHIACLGRARNRHFFSYFRDPDLRWPRIPIIVSRVHPGSDQHNSSANDEL